MTTTVHLVDSEMFNTSQEAYAYVADAFRDHQLCRVNGDSEAGYEVDVFEEIDYY
jgi:hypothetical protein